MTGTELGFYSPAEHRLLCDIVLMTTKERNVVRIVR
jgi:hypothetical protein